MKLKVVTIDVDSGDMWRGAVMLYLVVVVVYCAWMISIINNNVTVTITEYEETPNIHVSARYSNLTTISVTFSEPYIAFGKISSEKITMRVDRAEIYIDSVLVDTIDGSNLFGEPYLYPVTNARHDLRVTVCYKNGENFTDTFSNSALEWITSPVKIWG